VHFHLVFICCLNFVCIYMDESFLNGLAFFHNLLVPCAQLKDIDIHDKDVLSVE
jgi:hypothetical protein